MQKASPTTASRRGFTLVEVMMAAFVLIVALLGCLSALMQSFQLMEDARNRTLAGQIVQSDIETTRLFSFTKLPGSGPITLDPAIIALNKGFTAERTVSNVAGCVDVNGNVTMKLITVAVSWKDARGRSHTYNYSTCYGKGGLSDYFVTNRPAI